MKKLLIILIIAVSRMLCYSEFYIMGHDGLYFMDSEYNIRNTNLLRYNVLFIQQPCLSKLDEKTFLFHDLGSTGKFAIKKFNVSSGEIRELFLGSLPSYSRNSGYVYYFNYELERRDFYFCRKTLVTPSEREILYENPCSWRFPIVQGKDLIFFYSSSDDSTVMHNAVTMDNEVLSSAKGLVPVGYGEDEKRLLLYDYSKDRLFIYDIAEKKIEKMKEIGSIEPVYYDSVERKLYFSDVKIKYFVFEELHFSVYDLVRDKKFSISTNIVVGRGGMVRLR